MVIHNKQFSIPILLLIFGIAVSTFSSIISINTNCDWFARFAAILIFISVIVQFLLSNLKKAD